MRFCGIFAVDFGVEIDSPVVILFLWFSEIEGKRDAHTLSKTYLSTGAMSGKNPELTMVHEPSLGVCDEFPDSITYI